RPGVSTRRNLPQIKRVELFRFTTHVSPPNVLIANWNCYIEGEEEFEAIATTKPSLASRLILGPVVSPSCSPEVDTRTFPVHSVEPTETLAGSDPRLRATRIRSEAQDLT